MSEPKKPNSSNHPLQLRATGGENGEFNQATKALVEREAAKLAAELKSGAKASNDPAVRYLRESSLMNLKGNLPDASIAQLRNALANAWNAGGSLAQLMAAIKKTMPAFPNERAEMIAQTVANSAYNFGGLATARAAGLDEKSWSADGTDACDECRRQMAAGWIPIDERFPGGVIAPCLHDGCDCGMSFRGRANSRPRQFKVDEVERLIREGREEEAEPILLGLIASVEQEARTQPGRVPSWFYEQLAIIYRRRCDYASEVAILTRYCQQGGNRHEIRDDTQKRLDRAHGLLAKADGRR